LLSCFFLKAWHNKDKRGTIVLAVESINFERPAPEQGEFYLDKLTYISMQQGEDWSFQLHSHQDMIELSLVLHGKAYVCSDGKLDTVEQGQLYLKNAGVLHSEEADRLQPFSYFCLGIKQIPGREKAEGIPFGEAAYAIFDVGSYLPFLEQAFYLLFSLASEKPAGYHKVMDGVLKAIQGCIEGCLPQHLPTHKPDSHQVIRQLTLYLNENFEKELKLADLAKRFYFSTYYLERKFKEETGYSIIQYLINRRIGEAERLLAFENSSAREIAKQCGFTNLQYFYTVFKKHTGYTPAEFRIRYGKSDRLENNSNTPAMCNHV
jgi:AraC-like DNA-binding protein/quercetin dioxygenase-like cupin family protein